MTLLISPTTLPAGNVGTDYSVQFSVTGGTPPYTWQCSVSDMPPGFTMSAAGLMSGTASAAFSQTTLVSVTDSSSPALAADSYLPLVIAPASVVQIAPVNQLFQGNGLFWSLAFSATGGQPPYSWSAINCRVGLSPAGMLSGQNPSGNFSFTIIATDTVGATCALACQSTSWYQRGGTEGGWWYTRISSQ